MDKLLAIGSVLPIVTGSRETVSPNSLPSLGVSSTLQLCPLEIKLFGTSVKSSI